jgi:hypothetical protein
MNELSPILETLSTRNVQQVQKIFSDCKLKLFVREMYITLKGGEMGDGRVKN